ncbi:MAG: clan AA aspartic protease [Planctomycetia bacterium]|jgi:clan AA aspartic protease|nr:clan AA aspartic protease [Planctomycetia bacterium]
MISGAVNADLEAILRLTALGPDGKTVEIDAVVDTGFNGYLTLPTGLIEELKLPWLFRQQGELADGSLHVFDVHAGTILWDGQHRTVEIEVADTEPLVGMAMLQNQRLNIDVTEGGSVSITNRAG